MNTFSVKRQVFWAGMLESSDIIASGFESHSMADYACYVIANKAQYDESLKGCHVVYCVV
jgi:hypothetical protein